jgi:glycosyltransferase involved in cell wall biosynthesis
VSLACGSFVPHIPQREPQKPSQCEIVMRIAIDGRTIVELSSGVGMYAERIVRGLLQIDHHNEYFLFLTEPAPTLQFPNLTHILIDGYHQMFLKQWWENISVPHFLAARKIDLYFSPSYTLPILPRFANFGRLLPLPAQWKIPFNIDRRVKYVTAIHDLVGFALPETFTLKMRLWQRLFVSNAVHVADRILASSESTQRDLFRFFEFDRKKVSVVYLSLDDRFAPVTHRRLLAKVRTKYSLPERFILSVGTIEPRKNIAGVARAYSLLPQHLRDKCKLIIAGGKGWHTDAIFEEIKQLGIQDDVTFLGFVDHEDLPSLYSLAAVLVYPSLYEGFGFPPLEAMACGTPVITSTRSSLPEVVGHAAILTEPTDYRTMCNEMCRVLTDEKIRAELKRKGLRQAKRFGWRPAAEQTLKIFESTMR